MDESAHPNKPSIEPPTPEVDQLLRLIELQTQARREQRMAGPKALQTVSFRWGSIAVIIVFALVSIAAMEWIVSQIPKPPAPAVAPVAPPMLAIPAKTGNSAPISGAQPVSNR